MSKIVMTLCLVAFAAKVTFGETIGLSLVQHSDFDSQISRQNAVFGYCDEWNQLFASGDPPVHSVDQLGSSSFLVCGPSSACEYCAFETWMLDSCGGVIGQMNMDDKGSSPGPTWSSTSTETRTALGRITVDRTEDGGYLAHRYKTGNTFLLKYDSGGNVEWQWIIPSPERSIGVHEIPGEGYLLFGQCSVPPGSIDIWVARLDTSGTRTRLDTVTSNYDIGKLWMDARATTEGGCIVVSDLYTGGTNGVDILLTKLSANGVTSWTKQVGSYGDDHPCSIALTDGGYVISATSGWNYRLMKLGTYGMTMWDRTYSDSCANLLYDAIPTANGGYLLGGTQNYTDTSADFYVIKTNASGVITGKRIIDLGGTDILYSCRQTSDGRIVMGGTSIQDGLGRGVAAKAAINESPCCIVRGDVDYDGLGPDISDIVYLQDYMFNQGPSPLCLEAADIDGSGGPPDIADLVYLATYMFANGPAPAPCP